MIPGLKNKLPNSINNLSEYRIERLYELLSFLYKSSHVIGVLLGGSFAYKENIEKSDIDLFCLMRKRKLFEVNLIDILSKMNNIEVIIYQGYFPWTEKLYTIYFKQEIDFSIDLCLINYSKAKPFFWEPDGYILFDKMGLIKKYRNIQLDKPFFTKQPFLKSNPFSLAVVTLKKIDKNLSRGHLWNAIEILSILRRYIIQIIRLNITNDNNFLGRVDRDIEDVISKTINKRLSQTIASYDKRDIANKAILLIDLLDSLFPQLENSNEKIFQEWVTKQVRHEKNKLLTYLT